MDDFTLHSSLLNYDPEEEERKRVASLAALAAQANPDAGLEAFTPQLDPDTLSAPTRTVELPQVDVVAEPAPEPAPAPFPVAATSALAEAGRPPAPPAPMAMPSPQAPSPPPEQDPLAALMQRGEEQRQRALEEYGKNEPAINGWALLADVAFNRGKSIPQMLQQVDNDKRAWREGRAKLLTGGHSDPINQAIALGNLQARQATGSRLANRDALAAEQDANARNAFMSSWGKYLTPEEQEGLANAPAATFRTMAVQIRDRIKNSREYQKDHARGVTLDTTARVSATNETNAEQAPLLEKAARARGTGHFSAQAEYAPNMPQTPGQIRDDERAEESLRLQRENTEETRRARADAAKASQENKDIQHENTFTKAIEKARPLALELQSVEDIINDYKSRGEAVPGIGPGGTKGSAAMRVGTSSLTPEWIRGLVGSVPGVTSEESTKAAVATKVRGLIENFARDNIHNRSGAAFNLNEEQINAILAGASKEASLEQVETALNTMHMLVEGQISASASPIPKIAAKNLRNSGIDPMRFGGLRWLGQQQSAAVSGGGVGGDPELAEGQSLTTNEDGEEVVEGAYADPRDATPSLGTTSSVPKIQKPDKRTYTVTLPSGKSKRGVPLSDNEVERYRLKGIRVE